MRLLLVFSILVIAAHCRVKFTYSSLYDEYDLVAESEIKIDECSSVKQCAIFVSVPKDAKYQDYYDNIQLFPEDRSFDVTLSFLSSLRDETSKAIVPYFIVDEATNPSTSYFFYNNNTKGSSAPLVIYAVELAKESNYDLTSGVYDAADISHTIHGGNIVTILSATPFKLILADNQQTLASIFATGFDNANANDVNPDQCRQLIQAKWNEVSFQINGPIASIYFSDFDGKLVNTVNSITAQPTYYYDIWLQDYGFVTSQGYVGCSSGQVYRSSLYSDHIQYRLYTELPQYIQQTIRVNTDNNRPLSIQMDDKSLQNFFGTDLLATQNDCGRAQQLTINFDQSGSNSFAIRFSYGNYDCEGRELTSPATDATTAEAAATTAVKQDVPSTAQSFTSSSISPVQTTTIYVPPTTSLTAEFNWRLLTVSLVALTVFLL